MKESLGFVGGRRLVHRTPLRAWCVSPRVWGLKITCLMLKVRAEGCGGGLTELFSTNNMEEVHALLRAKWDPTKA